MFLYCQKSKTSVHPIVLVFPAVLIASLMGCSALTDRSTNEMGGTSHWGLSSILNPKGIDAAKNSTLANLNLDNERVANPPARTMRFDGHQTILGNGIASTLPVEELRGRLKPLLEKEKMRSAKRLVQQYGETSERFLAEKWASESASKETKLIAATRSKRSGATASTDWNALLKVAGEFPAVAQEYQRQRNAFALALQSSDPEEQTIHQLKQACTAVGHPIVEMDCLRLLGLRAVVAEQWANAESLYRQALAVAVRSNNNTQQADLNLLLAEAAKRNNPVSTNVQSFGAQAILNQMEIMNREHGALDIEFWLRIEQLLPDSASWPATLTDSLSPYVTRTLPKNTRSPIVLFWSAIAQAQTDRSEMQLALVNLKKAETLANGDDVLWLRVAESKCLASIGQSEAAIAILSGPATSHQPAIASAAIAALGSVKLQTGAYQQGAQLLNKALKKSPDHEWPSRAQAVADLALAQLIIGSTEQGLVSVHEAQSRFQTEGDFASLTQSLENESRLLEHEGRKQDRALLEERIAAIEAS